MFKEKKTVIIPQQKYAQINFYQMSDAHYEFITEYYPRKVFTDNFKYVTPDATCSGFNVLLLCGDIFSWKRGALASMLLKEICSIYDYVAYIPGNHEYFATNIESAHRHIRNHMADVKNFVLLQNESILFKLGTVEHAIIGSTFWTDIGSNKKEAAYASSYLGNNTWQFSDFKRVRNSRTYSRLKIIDIASMHHVAKKYVFNAINYHKGLGRSVGVMTHHAPSFKSATHFKKHVETGVSNAVWNNLQTEGPLIDFGDTSAINPIWDDMEIFEEGSHMYCTNYDKAILNSEPDFWSHGHLHELKRYRIGKTLINCDPIGYFNEPNPRTSGLERLPFFILRNE